MFIYHFNRMIRSRLLWIIFAIIIAVAFLSVDSCYRAPSEGDGGVGIGTIGKEKISPDEYELARRFVENATRDLPPAATETQVWAHIAAMRAASEMGLSATPAEVTDLIAGTPAFQQNGVFNKGLYAEMLRRNLDVTPATYERLLADQIVLTKLMSVVAAGSPVPQMAVEDEAAARTDFFTFRYASLSNQFARAEVEPGEEALKAYYDEHSADFALPDRVQVRYIALPVTNFTAAAEISEVDIEDYYESDPDRYTREGTNGVERLSLAEAREAVSNELALIEACHIAVTNLAAFMDDCATNDLATFTWRAKARGYMTADTPLFAYDAGYIPGIEAAALEEFRDGASDLDTRRADALYGIARGRRTVYLMRVATNDAAHTPSYETLHDTLPPLVVAQKRRQMFSDYAGETFAALKAALPGKGFEAACGELSLGISTSIVFSVATVQADTFPNARAIVPEVVRAKAGELAGPVDVFGGAVIAYVESRTPGEAFEVASAREAAAGQLGATENASVFADWVIWNLTSRGFTSKRLDAILQDDGADEEDFE